MFTILPSLRNSVFDVALTALFGPLGSVFVKLECEPPPLLLGFIRGPMMEENLRGAMLLSRGDPSVCLTGRLSLARLVAAAFLMLLIIAPTIRMKREETFPE